jgi:N utilization substance protein A
VEIKAIAREAGSRSKVAVHSRQSGLDPVGACVGQRGMRIQNIVNELGGERIDIIPWHEDPAKFVANALSPARVLNVSLDEGTKTASVTVPEAQLSLAIGKEGQNARLAAKLTGWRVDIKSDAAAKDAVSAAVAEPPVAAPAGAEGSTEAPEAPEAPQAPQAPQGADAVQGVEAPEAVLAAAGGGAPDGAQTSEDAEGAGAAGAEGR